MHVGVDGPHGVGKTSVVSLLGEKIGAVDESHRNVHMMLEETPPPRVLLGGSLSGETWLMELFMRRNRWASRVLSEDSGCLVIEDMTRYNLATYLLAFMGSGRLPVREDRAMEASVLEKVDAADWEPYDLLIVLTASPNVLMERILGRGRVHLNDWNENDETYLAEVCGAYDKLIRYPPSELRGRVVEVSNGSMTLQETVEKIAPIVLHASDEDTFEAQDLPVHFRSFPAVTPLGSLWSSRG